MTRNETEKLLQRYMDGLTSREEERLLSELVNAPDALEEWAVYRLMLQPLPPLPELLPQEEADEEYRQRTETRRRKPAVVLMRWAVAASVALIVGLAIWNPATMPQGTGRLLAEANEKESYAKAHEDNPSKTANPHDESWGYRRNCGSATDSPAEDNATNNPTKSAASTAPSVTPYVAQRSVGRATDDEETSVRPGVRLNQEPEELPNASPEPKPSSPGYSSPRSSRPEVLFASLSPEERLMKECDRLLLEEEYQYSEQKMRLVEL